ncbi:hypothetical protein EDD16DRAFT_1700646 [Pisolithus croceorrhizus]|nr:hypothetical protein EDD16DRAFT_1700646 [Pisolithus croceorrhizus]
MFVNVCIDYTVWSSHPYSALNASDPLRRQAAKSHYYTFQLLRYSHALNCIRSEIIHADDVVRTFWTPFLMFMEDDRKDCTSLEAAGFVDFVDCLNVYNGHWKGWPAENTIKLLALWLLWIAAIEDRLRAESSPRRAQMIKLMLSFVAVSVRYPSRLAPDTHFPLPLSHDVNTIPHTVPRIHGPYPHYTYGWYRSTPLCSIYNLEIGVPMRPVFHAAYLPTLGTANKSSSSV